MQNEEAAGVKSRAAAQRGKLTHDSMIKGERHLSFQAYDLFGIMNEGAVLSLETKKKKKRVETQKAPLQMFSLALLHSQQALRT